MFLNIIHFCYVRLYRVYFNPRFINILPKFCIYNIMDTTANINVVKKLFGRLQEAKSQAEQLQNEIHSIKQEIQKAEGWSLFQLLNEQKNDVDVNDGPDTKKTKYSFPMRNGYVVAYTDGACEGNGTFNAKAGIGVWFGDNHPLNVSRPVRGKATNNAAEIQACISAVQIAKDNNVDKLKIITDSQFTINSMTKWIKGWKKRNWKLADGKSDVKNKTDFQELDRLCQGLDVQWEHVSGHTGVEGNEKADQLAREGAKMYK